MKKFREINVDGTKYAWAVREMDWPKAELKIWEKRRGKVAWCQLSFELTESVITPKQMRQVILRLLENQKAKICLADTKSTFVSELSVFSKPQL